MFCKCGKYLFSHSLGWPLFLSPFRTRQHSAIQNKKIMLRLRIFQDLQVTIYYVTVLRDSH